MAILTMRQISGKRVIDENPRIFKFCAYFSVGLLMRFLIGWSTLVTFAILFIIYVTTGGWRFLRVVIFTIKRDLRGLFFLIYTTILLKIYKRRGETIINLFQKTAKRYPNKGALVMVDERSFTFKEVDALSNAVANCFYDLGYKKGDVVAIFMENCPEFVILWLGLAKIGVVPALINFNLKMKTLAHCISVSEARALIYGSELSEVVKESKHLLPPGLTLFSKGKQNPTDLDEVLKNYSTEFIQKNVPAKFNDRLLYIFTSGTTGLPKAAVVIHSRYFYMANAVYMFYKMVPEDIIYDTLPLYHTAGGILGIGNCLINGCTVVMRKKFSASKFWTDCIKHDCTVAQYIGEICRYLLVQPSSRNDKGHRVRLVFGNGLRPHIWDEFKTRFNIAQIGEFYGATEGNANIANIDNTKGAVGFQSRILPTVYPVTLIKVNLLTGEPVRNMYGLCIRCEPGEPGELVGKIVSGKPLREFDGYANKEANNKKLVKNVFKRGDCYFLTGDVLEMDEFGYMYFRDRTGDTYRWKGENVSTSEVEGVVSNAAQLSDAVVYGVEVPGTEGRAGMAAIGDPHRVLDLKAFNRALQKMLPPYARPMFIRVLSEVETTGTFKLKKADYRNEGFNPSIIQDDLYYYNSKMSEFETIDGGIYEDILTGRIKF